MEETLESAAAWHLDAASAWRDGETISDRLAEGWEPDPEPEDWHDELIATVEHTCGCTQSYWNCAVEDVPPASAICRDCRPCSTCGKRQAECSCPIVFHDPFAEEEAAAGGFSVVLDGNDSGGGREPS
jgi:hypothetical protein